jgi:hypothetical protein
MAIDPQTNPLSVLSFIVAPAILTNATSILISSTSVRLGRAVDRARELTIEMEYPEAFTKPVARTKSTELAAAQKRMLMLIRALRAFYLALGSFAGATLLSLVGAIIVAYVPATLALGLELLAIGAGATAVGGLVRGAFLLVRETRIAVGILQDRARRVQAEFAEKNQGDRRQESE